MNVAHALALTPQQLDLDSLARWLVEDPDIRRTIKEGRTTDDLDHRLRRICRRGQLTRTQAIEIAITRAIHLTNQEK